MIDAGDAPHRRATAGLRSPVASPRLGRRATWLVMTLTAMACGGKALRPAPAAPSPETPAAAATPTPPSTDAPPPCNGAEIALHRWMVTSEAPDGYELFHGRAVVDAARLKDGSVVAARLVGPTLGEDDEAALLTHRLEVQRFAPDGTVAWAHTVGPYRAFGGDDLRFVWPQLAASEGRIVVAIDARGEATVDGGPPLVALPRRVGGRAEHALQVAWWDAITGERRGAAWFPPVARARLAFRSDGLHLIGLREEDWQPTAGYWVSGVARGASGQQSTIALPPTRDAIIARDGSLLGVKDDHSLYAMTAGDAPRAIGTAPPRPIHRLIATPTEWAAVVGDPGTEALGVYALRDDDWTEAGSTVSPGTPDRFAPYRRLEDGTWAPLRVTAALGRGPAKGESRLWLATPDGTLASCRIPCAADADLCEGLGHCQQSGSVCELTDVGCAQSRLCRVDGRCAKGEDRCIAVDEATCKASEACATAQRCMLSTTGDCTDGCDTEPQPPHCPPPPGALCDAEWCAQRGECESIGMDCIPRSDRDCLASSECRSKGNCRRVDQIIPSCGPGSHADCRASDACRREGRCTRGEDPVQCEVGSDADCRPSRACRDEGRCTMTVNALGSRCEARSSDDCRRSTGCRKDGRCQWVSGRCDVPAEGAGP